MTSSFDYLMEVSMKRRYREIINSILNSEDFISGKELADQTSVSLRTIRKDIVEINFLLSHYDIKIESLIKKGYHFIESNKKRLKDADLIRKVFDYEYIVELPSTPFDRQMYILLRSTVDDHILIEDLSSFLYVSHFTIMNDVDAIRKWFHENLDLSLTCSLNEGLKLNATEFDKRNLISWIFSRKTNTSTISKYSYYLYGDNRIIDNFKSMFDIVSFEAKKFSIYFSGHSAQVFSLEVIMIIQRNQAGFLIDQQNTEGELIPFIIALRDKVEKLYENKLTFSDWIDIQSMFISKQFLFRTNMDYIVDIQSELIVNQFIKIINDKYSINLGLNPKNREKLYLCVGPMVNRLKFKHPIANMISGKTKSSFEKSFEIAENLNPILQKNLNLKANVFELIYLAIHIEIMKRTWPPKLKTVLVCDHDESIISYIRDRINHYFSDEITVVEHLNYLDFISLGKTKERNVDFIISTSNLADITESPFVMISPILDPSDILRIRNYLNHRKQD